jgi:hypothetical protein
MTWNELYNIFKGKESKESMEQIKHKVIILELGHLLVITFQSSQDIAMRTQPTAYFWQEKTGNVFYGPFSTIYTATKNYSDYMESLKKTILKPSFEGNVIPVDFKNKRRYQV